MLLASRPISDALSGCTEKAKRPVPLSQPIWPMIAESKPVWVASMANSDLLTRSAYSVVETELSHNLSTIGLNCKESAKRSGVDAFVLLEHEIVDPSFVQAMGQRQA